MGGHTREKGVKHCTVCGDTTSLHVHVVPAHLADEWGTAMSTPSHQITLNPKDHLCCRHFEQHHFHRQSSNHTLVPRKHFDGHYWTSAPTGGVPHRSHQRQHDKERIDELECECDQHRRKEAEFARRIEELEKKLEESEKRIGGLNYDRVKEAGLLKHLTGVPDAVFRELLVGAEWLEGDYNKSSRTHADELLIFLHFVHITRPYSCMGKIFAGVGHDLEPGKEDYRYKTIDTIIRRVTAAIHPFCKEHLSDWCTVEALMKVPIEQLTEKFPNFMWVLLDGADTPTGDTGNQVAHQHMRSNKTKAQAYRWVVATNGDKEHPRILAVSHATGGSLDENTITTEQPADSSTKSLIETIYDVIMKMPEDFEAEAKAAIEGVSVDVIDQLTLVLMGDANQRTTLSDVPSAMCKCTTPRLELRGLSSCHTNGTTLLTRRLRVFVY
eukprot:TRINITY_DN766_c0_g1_i3.p1 TRINITY_DN766_c0_g1~~TRINITY_DN766_c0_g1_i3.p1  ORF type:complete len:440 (-),score=67.42 TRINITY_DN766_c0_g1_i3:260-1579(-)